MLTCKVNGKRYIGQSKNIRRRLLEHRKCKSFAPVISKAIKKYGWENFDKELLEQCSIDELNNREIYYIARYKPEYNLTIGGDGLKGYEPSSETKAKLSEAAKKQWQLPEQKARFQKPIICIETGETFESVKSAAIKAGVNHSSISQVLNGKTKTAGGYHWEYLREDDKQKRGHHFSDDVIEHFRKINLGRKMSAKTIEKLSEKAKQRGNKHCQKSVICIETGEIFESVKNAADKIGVVQSFLSKVLNGKKKTAGGYHWKFVKE